MSNVRLPNDSQKAAMDAVIALLDAGAGAGLLKIYDGVQPSGADTAITTQTLLGTCVFSDPAFGAADNDGVVTADTITSDSSADATGVASWARLTDSDGNTVMDVDVGLSGATLNLDNVNIETGGVIAVTNLTFTMPDGT